jgi:hypothetical protein
MRQKENYVRFQAFTVVTMKNAVLPMVCHVALVRAEVPEERIASIITVTKIGDLAYGITSQQTTSFREGNL